MTDHYYLVGGNVSRSPSPAMMTSAFRSVGLDADYTPVSMSEAEFSVRFATLNSESSGMNITIPFKSKVIPLLDGLDVVSRKIGAVNVVKRSGGRSYGYNTDVEGILVPLTNLLGQGRPERALILGAGGAARAFCEAMAQLGCRAITVAVRDVDRARSFVGEASSVFPDIDLEVCSFDTIERRADVNIVFNATPMGSVGVPLDSRVGRAIHGTEIVFDAVYRPVETELLKFAKEKGCRVIHGYDMLLNQGTGAFERWTGLQAPVETMRRALLSALEVDQN